MTMERPATSSPFQLPATLGLFALASLILAWAWLSGAVTIPWDAKSQFFPQVSFLAASLARGETPSWTPNVFAGWPQISAPQSLILSPLHLLLAFGRCSRGGDRLCVRRGWERAAAGNRAGQQALLPAAGAVDAGACARGEL